MNQDQNVGNETTRNTGLFYLFNMLPVSFWTVYSTLYTHFLDKGVGAEQASRQTIEAIQTGLPGVQTLIGNLGIAGINQRGAA